MCGNGSFLHGLAMVLGGAGTAYGGKNQASDNYNSCVENQLDAMRSNAGIPNNTIRCISRQIASDEIQTVCR